MSLTDVRSAVYALYHDSATSSREHANAWLQEWQKTEGAWNVCCDVLQQQSQSDLETCYFAAQTLRTKVVRDFEELPGDVSKTMPETILGMVSLHAKGPPAVRTQLCLALAALALHIPSSEWPGGSLVRWIGGTLGGLVDAQNILLEVLTVIPQEASTYQPSILPERRRQLEEEMVVALPQALELLWFICERNTSSLEHVLEAFAAWLRLTGDKTDPCLIQQTRLVPVVLDGLRREDTFFAAVDAIVEVIYCSSHKGRPKKELEQVVQALVSQVMGLLAQFHICTQQAVEEESHHGQDELGDYEERAKALARLFAEVGEAYVDLICEANAAVMGPVEALLDVSRYPDMDVCSISFNFWHQASYILSSGKKPHSLNWEGVALPEEEAQRRIDAFQPYVERLVEILNNKLQYPETSDHWHSDEKSEFKYTRQMIGDLLLDCTDVLGPDRCVSLLVAPLSELSASVQAGQPFDWKKAEASIYSLRSIHRSSSSIQNGSVLVSLLSALSSLPSYPHLDYTVALMLGSYSDWLANQARKDVSIRQLIGTLVGMVIKGLGNEHSSSACALSLRNLCLHCGVYISDLVPQLLDLYLQVQRCGDISSGEETSFLDEEDVENIVEAVTLTVSSLPRDVKQATVQQMIDSVVQPIRTILDPIRNGVKPESMRHVATVLPLFERITTILRHVDDVDDVALTLDRLLPWIETSFSIFETDALASEKICRVPRYAVRTAKQATRASLPRLSTMLMGAFERTRHSCYLYVASELVKTFGADTSQDAYIQPLLCGMILSSCGTLVSLEAVSANPELTDDTFLLAGRGLHYAPRLIMVPEVLSTLIVTCRNAILVQHREACTSVAAFLVRVLDPGTHRQCDIQHVKTLELVFQPYASILTQLTIAGAVGALPTSRIHDMVDVLYALLKSSNSSFQWINAALSLVPESAIPTKDKDRFLHLCRTIVSDEIQEDDERRLLDAMVELSEVCRRHHKVQSLVMQSVLPTEYQYYNTN